MRKILFAALAAAPALVADPALLETHCSKCHNDDKLKGDFSLTMLGSRVDGDSIYHWEDALEFVEIEDMPPPDKSELSDEDRKKLIAYLNGQVSGYRLTAKKSYRTEPRRLNNRELGNSVRDALLLEAIPTNQPLDNLLGDTLSHGFDTNGEALGMSQYHVEQYIAAMRTIVDATILPSKRPETQRVKVKAGDLRMTSLSQTNRDERANRTAASIDILDMRLRAYFGTFETAPASGRYRIKIYATGKDRGIYDAASTGVYPADPIRLAVHLGDRVKVFDLPDEKTMEIELDEWLAAGTRIELSYPTDGLRMRGNGNFKFQYGIAHDYIKKTDPKLYARVVKEDVPKSKYRSDQPSHWSHWMAYWQGPRPRLFGAEVEGPIYESWPPKRQVALLGENPKAKNAAEILRPIAERAWRRPVRAGELDPIVRLVVAEAPALGDVEALKEGIVAILVAPSFLLVNSGDLEPADRFASKLSYFLNGAPPSAGTLQAARAGKLDTFDQVRSEVGRGVASAEAGDFVRAFPKAWLQLDRINFMAPDPERYPLYEKKRLSEDMEAEALRFFQHAIESNIPLPEFLTADYSFINADLANVYGIDGVPQDSTLRRRAFADGRRGGLLGMGAFLTLTADSLGTSPIHRAVYVMENFMGIHPAAPPGDVKIEEPDVRQAKSIKEILAEHTKVESCAGCHSLIDPYGYAFESFDPMGVWRDEYASPGGSKPSRKELQEITKQDAALAARGLPPTPKPWEARAIPIDASAQFRNGDAYRDIHEFRKLMASDANRDRFVRCFINKLLVYANGEESKEHWEINKIVAKSAASGYRIVDTIAAVVDSPLFREE